MTTTLPEYLLYLRSVFKAQHWRAATYSQHRVLDRFISQLDDRIDRLVEILLGIHGRARVFRKRSGKPVHDLQSALLELTLLCDKDPLLQKPASVKTVADELCGECQMLRYLLTLS